MNKNLKLVILIVVLVSAVFGGYFAWGFFKESKNQNNQQNGQISDLKTYRNEKYGFEFQYPEKKLNLHEYLPNTQINKFKNMVLGLNNPTPGGGFGRVDVYNTNFQFIDSIMEDEKGRFSNIISSKDSNFDNRPGKIFTGKIINFNGEGYEDVFYKTILIQYADDKVISIWGPSYTEANKEQDILFDEIVSTLKFFDVPKTNASNLKTYRSEKYGFEFQYPKEIVISGSDTEEGDLYFEFCNDVSCFMEPDFFEIKNTEITDIDQLTKNFYYSDYCGEFNEKGEPIPGSGLEKDRKIINSLDGKKGVLFYSSEYENDGCTIIQFLNEKKLFSFIIANWKEQKFDEVILSSFKFIKNSATDLKTYRNEKYGFEFQYPEKKLNLFEFSQNTQINKFKNKVLDLGYPGPYGGFVEINVYNTNFQFLDSIMKEGRFRNIISSKDSNFDNRPGKIFTGKIINFNGEGYEDVFYKTILIQHADDKVISILGPSYTEENKEQDILFDEIVSTLKFIN